MPSVPTDWGWLRLDSRVKLSWPQRKNRPFSLICPVNQVARRCESGRVGQVGGRGWKIHPKLGLEGILLIANGCWCRFRCVAGCSRAETVQLPFRFPLNRRHDASEGTRSCAAPAHAGIARAPNHGKMTSSNALESNQENTLADTFCDFGFGVCALVCPRTLGTSHWPMALRFGTDCDSVPGSSARNVVECSLEMDSRLKDRVFRKFFWSVALFESCDSDPGGNRNHSGFGTEIVVGWNF